MGNADARWLLRAGYTAAPIIAGLDKFFEKTVVWEDYLAPAIARRAPVSARTFMKGVGVIEVTAGLLVASRARVGPYVVAAWLGGIITNLLMHPRRYADIALRDFGLLLGAVALGQLDGEARRKADPARLSPGRERLGMTHESAVPLPQRLRPTLEEAPGVSEHV